MRKLGLILIIFSAGILFAACNPKDWKAKAGLQVEIKVGNEDVPAALFLDGKYLDKTPYANSNIQPGTSTLEIRPDNVALVPYQTTIDLKKGVLTFVMWKPGDRPETSGGVIYETESLKNTRQSELSITTIPDGGIIRVDNQAKGFAPVLVEQIAPGEHQYEVTLPSYEAQKNTINVLAGFRMNVTVKLARQTATFAPATPSANPVATTSATLTATVSAKPASASANVLGVTTQPTVAKPKVHILTTHFIQDNQEVLRVRVAPNATADTLGYAPVGSEYPYLNETTQNWYKVAFNGQDGWVSSQYAQLIQ